MSIFSVTYVYAAEGHSHELPGFLHFMEELIEEHSVLRGYDFWFLYILLIPLVGFYYWLEYKSFLKNNI